MRAAAVSTRTLQSVETAPPPASPAPIFHAFFGYLATAALGAAVRLGIFEALAERACDTRELAERVSADRRGTRILAEALAALGFLEPDGAGWRLTPVASSFLVRGRPAYLGDLANIFYSSWQWQGLLGLEGAVRAGGTVLPEQDLEVPLHDFWQTYASSWEGASISSAQALSEILGPWIAQRRPFSSLDLACGGGWYSFALATAHEHAQITLLDQPHVIAAARQGAERRGLLARTSFIEGDMFEVPLGGPYDLVIASNLLHLLGGGECRRLLRLIAPALKPDGRLAIHEFAARSSPAQEPTPRLFSLIMLVRTHHGQAHSLADYEQMLSDTGYAPPELHELAGEPTCVLLTQRAG